MESVRAAKDEFGPKLRGWLQHARQLKLLAYAMARGLNRDALAVVAIENNDTAIAHTCELGNYRVTLMRTWPERFPKYMVFRHRDTDVADDVVVDGVRFDLRDLFGPYLAAEWAEGNVVTLHTASDTITVCSDFLQGPFENMNGIVEVSRREITVVDHGTHIEEEETTRRVEIAYRGQSTIVGLRIKGRWQEMTDD